MGAIDLNEWLLSEAPICNSTVRHWADTPCSPASSQTHSRTFASFPASQLQAFIHARDNGCSGLIFHCRMTALTAG